MPFSSEDKAPIKNLYQFKEYRSRKILMKFSKTNYAREKLGTLLKQSGNGKHRPKANRHTHVTEENVTAVDELTAQLSHGRQKTNTSFNTPDIQRDGYNTDRSSRS